MAKVTTDVALTGTFLDHCTTAAKLLAGVFGDGSISLGIHGRTLAEVRELPVQDVQDWIGKHSVISAITEIGTIRAGNVLIHAYASRPATPEEIAEHEKKTGERGRGI